MSDEHSLLGASVAKQWLNCPGSIEVRKNAPALPPSEYAAEGTVAHAIASEKLNLILFGIDRDEKGEPINHKIGAKKYADGFEFRVTEEMLDAVDVYVDFVVGLVNQFKVFSYDIHVEKTVEIPTAIGSATREHGLWGKADCVIRIGLDWLFSIDYKHGSGTKVDVRENEQAQFYGLGAMYSLLDDWERSQIERITCVIVQPRGVGAGVTTWETTAEDIEKFKHRLVTGQLFALNPKAPRVAGDWCKFCPGAKLLTCKEWKDSKKFNVANIEVEPGDLDLSHIKMLPPVHTLTGEQIAKILNAEKGAIEFFEHVRQYAFNQLEAKVMDIPGYKIVQKTARNRVWKHDEETIAKEVAGLVDIYKPRVLRSPKQLEDLQKKLIKENPTAKPIDINALTEKPLKGAALVKDTDDRDEIDIEGLELAI